ncbi:aldehyde:ferredoxin oxidoreductase [Desulfobaculum xiamenense]|uniref:Aldehyde:ferredoxin oxidoreductase n=1 Tax=Desulfobaculum xiamenense TaxID=995050 RepID=A0A846QQ34_9BACT|nr:aldehyde ferredoxin oxidoreductase family protein [Desulfobaculum xiamenense]NJB68443.1 aldehyde:ferredoxin oxidoreductase [Desulfobaculum xiamenense]
MNKDVYGNMGTILRIDLTDESVAYEDARKYYKDWLGGRCLAHYLLFSEVDVARTEPLSPENRIYIGTGPLSGTTFPSSGRTHACFLSPMNYSGWGDSNCGGHFGPALKRCGFDMVVISGRAKRPVYLYVENDTVSILPADDLWGKGTIDTQAELIARHGEPTKLLCIGQGGENLVRFANVRTETTNSMGRCGLGAVFGSKNLKAVVAKGTKPVKLFKPKEFYEVTKQLRDDLMNPEFGKAHSATYQIMSKWGTPGITNLIGTTGMVPIRNWQRCGIDPKFDRLVRAWSTEHGTRREACFTCPVHCHAAYAVKDGKYPTRGGGPEYETTTALGHKCDVGDDKAVLKLNSMCNDYGLDTVECGALFSTLMELMERRIIDKEYLDGIDMQFGNADAMVEMMPMVVFRKGVGDQLADGPWRVCKRIGPEALKSCYHQKGMCATGVETRSTIGSMLQFAVSPRGSHHLNGLPTAEWVNIPPVAVKVAGYAEAGDVRSYHPQAKARLVRYYENMFFLSDSLGICKFNFGHLAFWHDSGEALDYMYDQLCKAIYYATGIKYTVDELFTIFERSNQIERATIVMRGCRREDDQPNWKCLNEACPGQHPVGPIPLPPIDAEKFNKILDAYYDERGWERETGIPKKSHLKKLGLGFVADKMGAALKVV